MRTYKAEWLKLRLSRYSIGILIWIIPFSIIMGASSLFQLHDFSTPQGSKLLLDRNVVDAIFAKSLSGNLLVLILGLVASTNEFRFNTATGTFLAQPRRMEVLKAKFAVAAIWGVLMMLSAVVVDILIGFIAFSFVPHASPHFSAIIYTLLAAVLIGALYSILGVAIGLLIRNYQVAANLGMIWFYIIEGLIVVFFPEVGKYLVYGLMTSIMNIGHSAIIYTSIGAVKGYHFLHPLVAVPLFVAYAFLIGGLATRTSLRRDL